MASLVCSPSGPPCLCLVGQLLDASGRCVFLNATVQTVETEFFVPPIPHLVDINVEGSNYSASIVIIMFIVLAVWLGATTLLRFLPLRGPVFTLRRFARWCDYIYSKRHWMDEQKCQVRHKTEVGGVASIGATIFILGFVISELYLFFTFSPYTVQSLFPVDERTLAEYRNNLNFSVTVLSNMRCRQLNQTRLLFGVPPYQQSVSSSVVGGAASSFTCADSARGPLVGFFCAECFNSFDEYFIEFSFVDTPDLRAAAYGFDYMAVATTADSSMSSIASGALVAELEDSSSVTLRGPNPSVLNFRFVPRVFRDPNTEADTRLMQVFFHEFILGDNFNGSAGNITAKVGRNNTARPGGCLGDPNCALLGSLSNPPEGTMVLHISVSVLSLYEMFTETVRRRDTLTLLASLGGLYKLGILIFFLAMNWAERFFKSVRYDDKLLDRMTKKKTAQFHWRKLRIAVKYGIVRQMAESEQQQQQQHQGQGGALLSSSSTTAASAVGQAAIRTQALLPQERTSPGAWWAPWSPSFLWRSRLPRDTGLRSDEALEAEARREIAEMDPAAARATKKGAAWAFPKAPSVNAQQVLRAAESFGSRMASETGRHLSYFHRRATSAWQPQAATPGARHTVYDDTRKGSQSEHVGMIVRSYKSPSWVPDYKELPHVPDFPPSVAEYLEERERRKRMELAGEDTEGLPPLTRPGKKELYKFLVAMDEYQSRLRTDFLLAQTMVENILQRFRPHSDL